MLALAASPQSSGEMLSNEAGQKLQNQTCILIAACEGQVAAALLSRRLIDRYWSNHPPVWLYGASIDDPAALPFRDEQWDWMAATRNAVRELANMGFHRAYLIMADLGPLDRCHEYHLNQTIPEWMTELDAAYISIRGWDHRRNSSGRSLGRRYLSLQQQYPSYWARFALHPALWRLDVLATILDLLLVKCVDHSAWTFEIEAGNLYDEIPSAWNQGTYRVCGRLMAAAPMPTMERWIRHGFDGLVRWTDMKFNHKNRRASLPPRVARVFHKLLMTQSVYYQGPYPVYFSGFLVRGSLNLYLVRFLRRAGRHDLLREIEITCPPA
jgi:hypothetical protein